MAKTRKSKMSKSKSRSRRMNKSRSRSRTRGRKYSKRGGAAPEPSYPIPMEIKQSLWEELMKNRSSDPRLEQAELLIDDMMYEPNYVSNFTGETFEGREDKEYWQGMDKIDSFFKGYI
jgi:hypothetical protein